MPRPKLKTEYQPSHVLHKKVPSPHHLPMAKPSKVVTAYYCMCYPFFFPFLTIGSITPSLLIPGLLKLGSMNPSSLKGLKNFQLTSGGVCVT